MQTRDRISYSPALQRDMHMRIIGHAGRPCMVFPSQNGRCGDFEAFGMHESCQPWIDQGKLKLYCVDSIDEETWSAAHLPPFERVRRHEDWFRYLIDEMWPFICEDSAWYGRVMTTGCSMGALHAVNALFRRPDLFDTVIALSGIYDPEQFLGGYTDDVVYQNSPISSIGGMGPNHPYIERLNTCRIILCVGQGKWEDKPLRSTRTLEGLLKTKGIGAWVDYWGADVKHDWHWWRKQLKYFLDKMMEE